MAVWPRFNPRLAGNLKSTKHRTCALSARFKLFVPNHKACPRMRLELDDTVAMRTSRKTWPHCNTECVFGEAAHLNPNTSASGAVGCHQVPDSHHQLTTRSKEHDRISPGSPHSAGLGPTQRAEDATRVPTSTSHQQRSRQPPPASRPCPRPLSGGLLWSFEPSTLHHHIDDLGRPPRSAKLISTKNHKLSHRLGWLKTENSKKSAN